MAQQRFDGLLQAIHNSVLRAQELTEEQHIHQLAKYFDEDGKPIIQEIQVPTLDPEDDPDNMVTLKVPLMSLLPPSAIKIKRLKVDFKAALGNLSKSSDPNKGPSLDIDTGGSGGAFGKNQSTANIEIEFEAGDPSESFLRINDHLIKSVV